MARCFLFWLLGISGTTFAFGAPPQTAPPPGLRENPPGLHALINARLVVAPGKVVERGTLVVRDGTITAAGSNVSVPRGARVWDLQGMTVYAGFIDAYVEVPGSDLNVETAQATGYWNSHIVPQRRVEHWYRPQRDELNKLRRQGITARLIAPSQEILRGTSALVLTGEQDGSRAIVRDQVAQHVKLWATKNWNDDAYPNSPMGAVSIVRQAFYDARWYQLATEAYRNQQLPTRPEHNEALEALIPTLSGERPLIVDTQDWLYALRADALGREFNLPVIIRGSGDEYQRLDAIRQLNRAVIVPVDFPKPPEVAKPEAALSVPLAKLMHWDHAPENPGRLAGAGVKIGLTTHGLKDTGTFLAQVRKAVARGLTAEAALRALTTTPAELFGVASRMGTLEAGKIANLVVTDGEMFESKTKIVEVWVDGRRYETVSRPLAEVPGRWEWKLSQPDGGSESIRVDLTGDDFKWSAQVQRAGKETKASRVVLDGTQLSVTVKGEPLGWTGVIQFSLTLEPSSGEEAAIATGFWVDAQGELRNLTARRLGDAPRAEKPDPKVTEPGQDKKPDQAAESGNPDEAGSKALFPVNYPLGDFGVDQLPEQPKSVVFRNARLWTCSPAGILEEADLLVEAGKITRIGPRLKVPAETIEMDARGKQITPGLIDCHSHIATDGGVNESGQTITAEVRIGDFIDPVDINIYRQLAGGVTASHILHGSANTIGGQCQLVKFRWGSLPEEMKFADAPPTIKFALGENVKQSNWGDKFRSRYPQTRMGVEQLLRDAFRSAVEYRGRWVEWRSTKRGPPPRVDLELEALAEVVFGQRTVHCHSYRQDEILATMRVFEDFGIRVGTFHHILEGYKVAEAMAKHGASGSSFSDWWAYKFEVIDAIPFNGALMHRAGIVVSFNSDDAELGRRLNVEAAKAVKYGGIPEAEALQFVTLNVAKQLGVHERVGSLEVGKEADLVVWNGSPLSAYTRCEQTWVDGRRYFSLEDDATRRRTLAERRTRLIQRILASGESSESPDEAKKSDKYRLPRSDMFCPHCALRWQEN